MGVRFSKAEVKLIPSPAQPLTGTECLQNGNPSRSERWAKCQALIAGHPYIGSGSIIHRLHNQSYPFHLHLLPRNKKAKKAQKESGIRERDDRCIPMERTSTSLRGGFSQEIVEWIDLCHHVGACNNSNVLILLTLKKSSRFHFIMSNSFSAYFNPTKCQQPLLVETGIEQEMT